jgi:hypothetical protein
MDYYNTNKLDGQKLVDAREKGKGLRLKVLDFFRANPNEKYTPAEVMHLMGINVPITSYRRAISDLTPMYLVKTDEMRPGLYESGNHCWTLRKGEYQMSIFDIPNVRRKRFKK